VVRRLTSLIATISTTVVTLVLAHELVFLARYGSDYGVALIYSGHGEAWQQSVSFVLLLGCVLLVAALLRLHQLGLRVRALARPARRAGRPPGREDLHYRPLLWTWLQTTAWLAPCVAILLTIQENAERAAVGLPTPGLWLLGSPDYPAGAWIVLAVSAVVALVASLYRWRRDRLVARLRAARLRFARAPRLPRLVHRRIPRGSRLARRLGLRAPPEPTLA
jgi:hypothetical protein